MAMHIGASDEDDEMLTAINTTPLVDVMLVLLIIFLITIPAVTASINVKLPQESQQPHLIKPESVVLTVNQKGVVFLDEIQIANPTELRQKLQVFADTTPQPDLQILGDAATEFQAVGQVLNIVKSVGLSKVHFITEPQEGVKQ